MPSAQDLILAAATAATGAYLHGYWLGLYSLTVLILGYRVDDCLGVAPEHKDFNRPG